MGSRESQQQQPWQNRNGGYCDVKMHPGGSRTIHRQGAAGGCGTRWCLMLRKLLRAISVTTQLRCDSLL